MKKLTLMALAVAAVGTQAQAVVLYDHSSFSFDSFYPVGAEYADDINLASVAPITSVTIGYYAVAAYSGQMTVNLYARTGFTLPGAAMATSSVVVNAAVGFGSATVSFANVNPGSTSLWVGMQFANGTNVIGALVGGDATIGSSADLFIQRSWPNFGGPYFFGGNPKANFAMTIESVPEPATVAAFGLGALGILARRRRK